MGNPRQPVLFVTFNCQGYFKVEKSAFKGKYGSSRIASWFELVRDFFKQYVHQSICTFVKNLSNLF